MKLPNGDKAIVPDEKLVDYLLNIEHPANAGHAVLFQQLLSIGRENAKVLRGALKAAARDQDASEGKPSQYGRK